MERSDTKKCPFCAGEIRAAAIKCRHCSSFLSEGMSPYRPKQPSSLATLMMVSVIFPGIGQFCNRQPIKAAILLVSFGISFAIVMIRGLTWYIAYTTAALQGELLKPPLRVIITFAALATAIYIYSVIDSMVVGTRRNRTNAEEKPLPKGNASSSHK